MSLIFLSLFWPSLISPSRTHFRPFIFCVRHRFARNADAVSTRKIKLFLGGGKEPEAAAFARCSGRGRRGRMDGALGVLGQGTSILSNSARGEAGKGGIN
jgi:hypothetical protein